VDLDRETVVKIVKEKGPTFVMGAMAGIAVFMAYRNRDKLVNVVENVLTRKKSVAA
jgi:hypothetical protein